MSVTTEDRPLAGLLAKWQREAEDRIEQAPRLTPAERAEALRQLREDPDWGDQPDWGASQ
jgi:hypothetical protein